MIEKIADMENLLLAFYKAQKGKSHKTDVIRYRENLDANLRGLQQQILTGKIDVGKYNLFNIYDPKQRVVCAAAFDERVLHHAIMNVCAPYFERQFIHTTYANRTGKGTFKALEEAHRAMGKYRYVAKLDVRKYFNNIDHSVLKDLLRHIFKDRHLLDLLSAVIESYEVEKGRGLPIGNLTSQYFANYYLSGLDHYAKEELRAAVYVRYMDDILLFGNDKRELGIKVEQICQYSQSKLHLEMKPPQIQQTSENTTFLGYCLHGRCISMSSRSKRRFERKYRVAEQNLTNGTWTAEQYQAHVTPLFAFTRHAYTKRYRQQVIRKVTVVGL